MGIQRSAPKLTVLEFLSCRTGQGRGAAPEMVRPEGVRTHCVTMNSNGETGSRTTLDAADSEDAGAAAPACPALRSGENCARRALPGRGLGDGRVSRHPLCRRAAGTTAGTDRKRP